jgi:hypothetical protein
LALSAFIPVLSVPSFLAFTLEPHYEGIAAHPCRRQDFETGR